MTTPDASRVSSLNPKEDAPEPDAAHPSLAPLLAVMDALLAPSGCAWDRAQTTSTLRQYLLEECYEVLDAIDREDGSDLREELGDLLFQILFLTALGGREHDFSLSDVIEGVREKLVRRHPHVFGGTSATNATEAIEAWENAKAKERAGKSALSGVPSALPALVSAQRHLEKTQRFAFEPAAPLRPNQLLHAMEAWCSSGEAGVAHDTPDASDSMNVDETSAHVDPSRLDPFLAGDASTIRAPTPVSEAQAPEAQAPEAQAPEAQAPEAQAPEAQAPEAQAPEAQALGRALFALVRHASAVGLDAEACLREETLRFASRFRAFESALSGTASGTASDPVS